MTPHKPPEFVPFIANVWSFGLGRVHVTGYTMFAARDLDAAVEVFVTGPFAPQRGPTMFHVREAT